MAKSTTRWPDFSEYGMRLVIVTAIDAKQRLVMVNGDRFPVRLEKLGFKKSASGHWMTGRWTDENGSIRAFAVSEFRDAFPGARVADMPVNLIFGRSSARGRAKRVLTPASKDKGNNAIRFIEARVAEDLPSITFPATINLMTEYTPGEDGAFPAQVHFGKNGKVNRVELHAARPDSGSWYVDAVFRISDTSGEMTSGWLLDGGEQTASALAEEFTSVSARFAGAKITQRSFSEWYTAAQALTDTTRAINDVESSYLIGKNERGEDVYENIEGRFVSNGPNKEPVIESVSEPDWRFMRAGRPSRPDWDGLISCAKGFVKYRDQTRVMDASEVRLFAATVFGRTWSEASSVTADGAQSDGSPRDIESRAAWANDEQAGEAERIALMALESVLAIELSEVYSKSHGNMDSVFDLSARALARQTPKGASALPLPLAASMRRALGQSFRTIADCNAESPIFLGMLPTATVATLLVKDDRLETYGGWFDSISSTIPVRHSLQKSSMGAPAGMDAMIGSFTTGEKEQAITPEIVMDQVKVSRADHKEVVELLPALSQNGAAVFLIDADTETLRGAEGVNAGEIGEDSTYFLNWLYDHYEVGMVADLDAALFSDGNALESDSGQKARRLLVINGRRPTPIISNDVPKSLDVITDYSALWTDVVRLGEANDKQSAHKAAAPVEQDAPPDDSAGRVNDINRDELQVRYKAQSQLSPATTMTPRNLADPTAEAFARLREDMLRRPDGTYRSIDDHVGEMLGMDAGDLGACLAPEQIDAVAMINYCHRRGRAHVLGDMTGIGKGRTLAAISRSKARQGRPVVMLTERRDLFTSFWRDITDVGADKMIKPFVINPGGFVRDSVGDVIDTGTHKRTKQLLDHLMHPDDVEMPTNDAGEEPNFFFMTYSQFSAKDSPKAEIIKRLSEGSCVIMDESHRGAGDNSNTSIVLADVTAVASEIVYSSATFAKTDYNIDLYSRIFPDSVDTNVLKAVIRKGGEPLQEVFSSMLARDGVLLRREHDIGELELRTILDEDHVERNRMIANEYAAVMSSAAHLGESMNGMRQAVSKALTNKAASSKVRLPGGVVFSEKLHISTPGFGSKFHNLTRQLLLGIKCDFVCNRAIQHAREGRKPLILLENTMEALLRRHLSDEAERQVSEAGVDTESAKGEAMVKDLISAGLVMDEPPQYRDLLRGMVKDALKIEFYNPLTRTRHKINVKSLTPIMDAQSKASVVTAEKAIDALLEQIKLFPDLPMSPIDVMVDTLRAEGLECGELTARSLSLSKRDDGKWVLGENGQEDRMDLMNGFNNGEIDVAILNRSASSGADLHSSENFADQKQRVLLEMQILENPTDRMQAFGRVNRRGQVIPPIIETISSGIPAENRILAMQNLKLRRQNATTTSNRESIFLADTVDILNRVGDETCRRYLQSNPAIAKRLSLSIGSMDDETIVDEMGSSTTSLSNLVTSRMILLDVDSQEALYEDLYKEYVSYIRELDNEGANPLRARQLPGECDIHDRVVAYGVPDPSGTYASEFDRPVTLTKVRYDIPASPLHSDQVLSRINKAQNRIAALAPQLGVRVGGDIYQSLYKRAVDHVDKSVRFWTGFNGPDYGSLDAAIAAQPNNMNLKTIKDRLDKLGDFLRGVSPGSRIRFSEGLFSTDGVVCDIKMPLRESSSYIPSLYDVVIAVPGRGVSTRSLGEIVYDEKFSVYPDDFSLSHPMAAEFDSAQSRSYPWTSWVLDGNAFMAAMVAHNQDLPSEPVVFKEAGGSRKRGMILNKVSDPDLILKKSAIPCPHFNLIPLFMTDHPSQRIASSMSRHATQDVFLSYDDKKGLYYLDIPTTKYGKDLRDDRDLLRLAMETTRRNKSSMTLSFSQGDIPEVIARVYSAGRRFMFKPRYREWLNEAIANTGPQNATTYLRNLKEQQKNANAGAAASRVAAATSGQAQPPQSAVGP